MSLESQPAVMVDPAELRREVAIDQTGVVEVSKAAGKVLGTEQYLELGTEITGRPTTGQRSHLAEWNSWKLDQCIGLEKVRRNPYFARVDVLRTTGRSLPEKLRIYVTAAEAVSGILEGDGWVVVSWTSDFSAVVLDRKPGDVIPRPERRGDNRYEIGVSGRFRGTIIPTMKDAAYPVCRRTPA